MKTRSLVLAGLLVLTAPLATAKMLHPAIVAEIEAAGENPAALAKIATANPILAIAVAQEAVLKRPAQPAMIAAAVAQGAPADSAGPVAAAVAVMVPAEHAPAIAAAVAAKLPPVQAARVGGMVVTAMPAQTAAIAAAVVRAVPECRVELITQVAKRTQQTPEQVDAAINRAAADGQAAADAGLQAAQFVSTALTAK